MKKVHLSTLLGRGLVSAPSGREIISMLPLRAAFIYLRTQHLIREETFELAQVYLKYRALVPREYLADGRILYRGRSDGEKEYGHETEEFMLFPGDLTRFIVRLFLDDKVFQETSPFRTCWELLLHTGRFLVPASYLFLADRADYSFPAEEDENGVLYYLSATTGDLKNDICELNILVPEELSFLCSREFRVFDDTNVVCDRRHFFLHGNILYYQNSLGKWKQGKFLDDRFHVLSAEKEQKGMLGFDRGGQLIYRDKKRRICRKAGKEASYVLCPDVSSHQIEICEDRLLFVPVFRYWSDDPGLPFAVSLKGEKQQLTSSEYASLFWRLCNEKCLDAVTPDKAEAYCIVRRKMNRSAGLTISDMVEIERALEEADLWYRTCTTVFSLVLETLAEQFDPDDDLHEVMFRLLHLNSLSSPEYLWDLVFYMKFDLFINEMDVKDLAKKLMSEAADDFFKDCLQVK